MYVFVVLKDNVDFGVGLRGKKAQERSHVVHIIFVDRGTERGAVCGNFSQTWQPEISRLYMRIHQGPLLTKNICICLFVWGEALEGFAKKIIKGWAGSSNALWV